MYRIIVINAAHEVIAEHGNFQYFNQACLEMEQLAAKYHNCMLQLAEV